MRENRSPARLTAALLLCAVLCAALCGCGAGSSYTPPVFSSPQPEEAMVRSLPGDGTFPEQDIATADPDVEPLPALRELPETGPAAEMPASAEEAPDPAAAETEESPEGPAGSTAPPEGVVPAAPDPDADYRTVFITDTGKKYHRKDCRHAETGFAVDIYTAVAAGYEACKVCDPPLLDEEARIYLQESLRVEDRSAYVPSGCDPSKIEQEEVESSFIAAMGYDGDARVLTILFHSGRLYAYYDVPREVYEAFRASADLGRAFTDQIRGAYHYEQLK